MSRVTDVRMAGHRQPLDIHQIAPKMNLNKCFVPEFLDYLSAVWYFHSFFFEKKKMFPRVQAPTSPSFDALSADKFENLSRSSTGAFCA